MFKRHTARREAIKRHHFTAICRTYAPYGSNIKITYNLSTLIAIKNKVCYTVLRVDGDFRDTKSKVLRNSLRQLRLRTDLSGF